MILYRLYSPVPKDPVTSKVKPGNTFVLFLSSPRVKNDILMPALFGTDLSDEERECVILLIRDEGLKG